MLWGKGQGVASGGTAAASYGLLRKRYTGIANEDAGSRDELGDLFLRSYAVGADQIVPGVARTPNPMPPTAAGAFHHLLHPLMAQFERVGKLPQGAACQMYSTDDGVVLRTCQLNLAFRVGERGSRGSSFFQQLLVDRHVYSY